MPLSVSDTERQELLVSYACMILNDDKVDITEDNIKTLISAVNGEVEPYWPKLFADLLQGRDVGELLMSAGAAGPAAGAAPAGDAAAPAAAEEEPEEESESEEDEDMGFDLFD